MSKTPKYETVLAHKRAMMLERAAWDFDSEVRRYSSPIEQVFVAEMLDSYWETILNLPFNSTMAVLEKVDEFGLLDDSQERDPLDWMDGPTRVYSLSKGHVFCATQHLMELPSRRIRPDFAFVLPGEHETKIIVELDGHDFHERTPEQAQSDKSRDRELQSMGWHVLRFTGREVLRDPDACLIEVHRLLFAKQSLARAKAQVSS